MRAIVRVVRALYLATPSTLVGLAVWFWTTLFLWLAIALPVQALFGAAAGETLVLTSFVAAIFFGFFVRRRHSARGDLIMQDSLGQERQRQRDEYMRARLGRLYDMAENFKTNAVAKYADGSPTNADVHIEAIRDVAARACVRADTERNAEILLVCIKTMAMFVSPSAPEQLDDPEFGGTVLSEGMEVVSRLTQDGAAEDAAALQRARRAAMRHAIPDMVV